MSEGGKGPTFEVTPSWIIGLVIFMIVFISLVVEKLLHYLGQKLIRNGKKHLYQALLKIKEELMLMGFISLLLAVFQDKVGKWCVPLNVLEIWLPCGYVPHHQKLKQAHFQVTPSDSLHNRGRFLNAGGGEASQCPDGKAPMLSYGILHHLHYFIFILAVVHVVTCTVTVLLGEMQISQWLKWEEDIKKNSELASENRSKVIDIRNLTFINDRFEGVDANKRNYVSCFFKHLCGIMTRADYEAMRFGFIMTHCHGNQRFNFHSWFLWLLVVMSMSLNVAGWHIFLWLLTAALLMLLVVGTKLQHVITELASHVAQRHTFIIGDISITPSDEYFWFKQPRIFLFFIHCVIFLNSYNLAIFFWVLFQFGFHSCIMGEAKYVYPRILIMVIIQAIISYSTLPLYAVVTQMGDSYNDDAMSKSGCWATDNVEDKVEGLKNPPEVEMPSK